ncbi:MAG: VOC family protein [Candidatus Dojkabacteria bacterium]|nr:MAG: VOC family protein [Candidatus Dojkabacteria bacterium]
MTFGIHHITALSSNAQKTYDFYTKILGLRFIKKTVNFDAPNVYHLYFGNESGEPGTALTFFPFENIGTGTRGPGQISTIYFAVPLESLGFWISRFIQTNTRHTEIKKKLGNSVLTFYDPDGLQLELVSTNENDKIKPWKYKDISEEYAIRGFYGAELCVDDAEKTIPTLELLGYEKVSTEEFHTRFINKQAESAKFLDIFQMKEWPRGKVAAGTNHHIAFRVPAKKEQEALREKLNAENYMPTPLIDRFYFSSIYFAEPSGILFEIATDDPGFTADEELAHLGESLKLPPKYEKLRQFIETQLPELYTGESSDSSNEIKTKQPQKSELFQYLSIPEEKSKYTLALFHGTGGDEYDLLPFVHQVYPTASVLSIRGNIIQHGMNRFFIRNDDGSFDIENITSEVEKLDTFLADQNISSENTVFIGFSNGANFILSYMLLHPDKVKYAVLMHPMLVLSSIDSELSLEDTQILVTSGAKDQTTSPEEVGKLKEVFANAHANVTYFQHDGGHEVTQEEVNAAKEWMEKTLN